MLKLITILMVSFPLLYSCGTTDDTAPASGSKSKELGQQVSSSPASSCSSSYSSEGSTNKSGATSSGDEENEYTILGSKDSKANGAVALKLTDANCKDPDPSRVLEGTSYTKCNGTTGVGTYAVP